MSHVTHRDESCRTCELVLLRMWASRVAFANESCSAYRWVMSRIRMSHVTHIYWVVSHIYRVGLEWVMSHSCRGSCYTHVVTPNEWVMSYLAVLPSATSVSCIAQTAERQIYGAISVSGIWHRYYTWHRCGATCMSHTWHRCMWPTWHRCGAVTHMAPMCVLCVSIMWRWHTWHRHTLVSNIYMTQMWRCDLHDTDVCVVYVTFEWVTARMEMSPVTYLNPTRRKYGRITSHIRMTHVTHANASYHTCMSCHTYKWVMSHIQAPYLVTWQGVISHVPVMSHV